MTCTSCKLRPNKELWAQIEKECLAIVSCDQHATSGTWICDHEVNVHTDHQPLETLFKKPPLHAAPRRLQKMMMQLQRYNKKGTSLMLAATLLSVTLSRARLPIFNDSKQTNFEIFRIDIDSNIRNPRVTSHTVIKVIEAATASDPTL